MEGRHIRRSRTRSGVTRQPEPGPGGGQRRIGAALRWAAPAVAPVLVAGLFAPWVRSGSATRSSFETLRTADRLGAVDGASLRLLAAVWVCLPAVAAILWLAALTDRRRLVNALGLALGAITAGGAVLVSRSGLTTGWGTTFASAAAVAMLVAAAAGAAPLGVSAARSSRRDR